MKRYIVLLLIFLAGCSGITVEKDIKVDPNDWVMSGGSPRQQNVSKFTLVPPLNLMWDYNIEGGVGPSGIAVSDAVVFVNALQGDLFTFDVLSGGKIGNLKILGKDCSTAPLVMGNNVILAFAGDKKYSLISYDLKYGKINWQKNYGDLQTSPVLYEDFIYVGSLNGNFYKIDPVNGKKIWKFDAKAQIHSTCAVSNGTAVFGSDKGKIYAVETATGNQKWVFETSSPVLSAPLINDDRVFIGCNDSNYYSLFLNDGRKYWATNLHSKIISGSAIDNDGNIYTGCIDGSIYKLTNALGEVYWKTETKGTIISSPVLSGEVVYVSSYDSYLYAFDRVSGKELWKSPMLENKIKTSPIIWRDYLFVAADEIVYCFTSKPVGGNISK